MIPAGGPATDSDLVERTAVRLPPDPSRIVSQLFVAGEEVTSGASRVTTVMARVLALGEEDVEVELRQVLERFTDRHADLRAELLAHFNQISDGVVGAEELSPPRKLLLGAYATSEYAVESVALCNPSMVAHPDQTGAGPGQLRFVLSLRAIGEGHLSSIEFRTGTLGPGGAIHVDDPGRFTVVGRVEPGPYDRELFGQLLTRHLADRELASAILGRLPPSFSRAELEASLTSVRSRVLDRGSGREMVDRIRSVAASNYTVDFPEESRLAERVLRPGGPAESRGMEDARFVRFVDEDSAVTYYGTYTAFDGASVSPHLLATKDFRSFKASQLSGRAAANKGMALFPRRIGGRYVALSRWDRESNAVTTSPDGRIWDDGTKVQAPGRPWELIQVGNCGSPIETAEGWLVITHGVGPMRTYSLGALLLDLDAPTVVRGQLELPLLEPSADERDGYVPNVVYSCGGLVHDGHVVLPYAYGDRESTFARIPLSGLLARLLGPHHAAV